MCKIKGTTSEEKQSHEKASEIAEIDQIAEHLKAISTVNKRAIQKHVKDQLERSALKNRNEHL